ncbi:MAG TPA: hypothetical protein VFD71_09340 [Planctomycetota bacterium]|jgi:hypothetical protein|nr:hypothetical protein [Planctomycetota bacterium]
MKKCSFCGTPWDGYGAQPRQRERCSVCKRSFHCCSNCHHMDRETSSRCRLTHTEYVGPRDLMNYCEDFRMLDTRQRDREEKISSARARWEQLFTR